MKQSVLRNALVGVEFVIGLGILIALGLCAQELEQREQAETSPALKTDVSTTIAYNELILFDGAGKIDGKNIFQRLGIDEPQQKSRTNFKSHYVPAAKKDFKLPQNQERRVSPRHVLAVSS